MSTWLVAAMGVVYFVVACDQFIKGGVGINKSVFIGQNVTVDGTIDSTNTASGAIICQGGLGVSKNVNIGQNVQIDGHANINGVTSTYLFATNLLLKR